MYDEAQMSDPKIALELFESFYASFQKYFSSSATKDSIRKEALCKVLFFAKEYLSADEIARKIKDEHRVQISLPTVHKMLAFLEEIHIVTTFLTYATKAKKYKLTAMLHYDHLMCTQCEKIIQFYNAEIEKKQAEIAKEYNFATIDEHTLVLYGLCKECQDANGRDKK